MGNRIYFKWVPSISLSKHYEKMRPGSRLKVVDVWTTKSLNRLVELAKGVEAFNDVKITAGSTYNLVLNSVPAPTQLISRLSVQGYYNSTYEVYGEGPSLEWLLKYEKELSNPNPNKLFYFNDMVVHFSSHPYSTHSVTIAILNTKHIDAYVRTLEYEPLEGLNKPFNEFLESYGYTDESTYENIAKVVLTFQAAKKLGFINAEEVATHFNDKCLVADLKLKGVLEDIETHCL